MFSVYLGCLGFVTGRSRRSRVTFAAKLSERFHLHDDDDDPNHQRYRSLKWTYVFNIKYDYP